MINKILFIEPKAPGLHIFTAFAIPRLGSVLLATLAKGRGYTCTVIIEDIESLKLQQLKQFDLVAISSITPTAPRAYAIADYCREINIPTILGGPHVTFNVEEALQHTEYVIRGEGEVAFLKFLEVLKNKDSFTTVPNLSYFVDGKIIHNAIGPCIKQLDELPHPDFSLIHAGMKDIAGGNIIPVQTSRGCPFDCTFCSVTTMFGRKYRTASVDYVLEEIMPYNENHKNFIFFYDDHFTANRKRTIELCEKMIKNGFKLNWSAQVRADVAKDEELVKLMKEAGCYTLFIGFESINPESLIHMNKKQTHEEIENAINVIKRNKIAIHGMFVFGFDEDTPETCKATIQFARKFNLESVQFLILTPFPGTPLHKQLEKENRILFRDWSLYDAHHVVFKPEHFSLFDLQLAQIKGHKKFYSKIRLLRNIIRFRVNLIVINVYARKINRLWKKLNMPYLKLMNLIKNSKKFEITASIKQKIDISDKNIILKDTKQSPKSMALQKSGS
jgi:radical SAM superfamily enzyme YgiQ (UPF0313 family)